MDIATKKISERILNAYAMEEDTVDITEEELTSFSDKSEALRKICATLNDTLRISWIRNTYWEGDGALVYLRECNHPNLLVQLSCNIGMCGCACDPCKKKAEEHDTIVQNYHETMTHSHS